MLVSPYSKTTSYSSSLFSFETEKVFSLLFSSLEFSLSSGLSSTCLHWSWSSSKAFSKLSLSWLIRSFVTDVTLSKFKSPVYRDLGILSKSSIISGTRLKESKCEDFSFSRRSTAFLKFLDIDLILSFGLKLSRILPIPGSSDLILLSSLIVSKKW